MNEWCISMAPYPCLLMALYNSLPGTLVRLQLKLVISETISYYQEPPKTDRNHFIYQEPLKKYKPFHNARNLVETIWNRFDYQGNH